MSKAVREGPRRGEHRAATKLVIMPKMKTKPCFRNDGRKKASLPQRQA